MLGLGSSIISSGYCEYSDAPAAPYDRSLPYQGSYVYLEDAFRTSNPNAGVSPVTVHSYNNISFDDTVLELYNFEGQTATVYSETTTNQATSKYALAQNSGILQAGDTVTISGNILRYDNGQVWNGNDTNADGNIDFALNGNDTFKVYIDLQNTSSITQTNRDRVDSNGAFSVSKVLAGNVTRFTITANVIADGGVMIPGVRITNLTMTKS